MKNATSYTPRPDLDPVKEQIKALWQEGKSSGQIALIVGRTRNSVIGIVSRMNLPTRTGLPRVRTKPRYRAPTAPKPVLPPPPVDAPPSLNLPMMELRAHHCQFPYGDSDFRFCGHDRDLGSTYCSYHRALCVQPSHPAWHT